MIRTLTSSLVAILIALGSLATASAELPDSDNRPVTAQEMLAWLQTIDPNVRMEQGPDGMTFYFEQRTEHGTIPMTATMTRDDIVFTAFLSKPFDPSKLPGAGLTFELVSLNLGGRIRFELLPVKDGCQVLVSFHRLKRNVSHEEVKRGYGSFLMNLASAEGDLNTFRKFIG